MGVCTAHAQVGFLQPFPFLITPGIHLPRLCQQSSPLGWQHSHPLSSGPLQQNCTLHASQASFSQGNCPAGPTEFLPPLWYSSGSTLRSRATIHINLFGKYFCPQLGASASLLSGFHAQFNGQTERINQELENNLQGLVSPNPISWAEQLIWVEYVCQASPLIFLPFSSSVPARERLPACQLRPSSSSVDGQCLLLSSLRC